jgi:hypothetical protein
VAVERITRDPTEDFMSKRPERKGPGLPPSRPPASKRQLNPLFLGGVAIVLAAVAVLAFWPGGDAPSPAAGLSSSSTATPGTDPAAQHEASVAAKAKFGPHTQATYPPIPFQGYAPPRPTEVVQAAYQFAAEHPEISSYVPCFCGCERSGHEGNTDCFVKSRAANGDVVEWDEHGLDCAVCIDVANRSRQMYSAGASVRDIRTAIDKEFGAVYQGRMPTPHPPNHAAH